MHLEGRAADAEPLLRRALTIAENKLGRIWITFRLPGQGCPRLSDWQEASFHTQAVVGTRRLEDSLHAFMMITRECVNAVPFFVGECNEMQPFATFLKMRKGRD